MGEIFIEGMGVVEIEGDQPTPQELDVILKQVGDPDDEGDPTITNEPDPLDPLEPGRRTDVERGMGAGINLEDAPTLGEGPLGIVDPETRLPVRMAVEEEGFFTRLAAEAGPSAAGAVGGASIGASLGGPAGMVGGAIIGGIGGELIAQESGLAPESEFNLALAGGGPLLGKGAGELFRGVRRGVGKGVAGVSFSKAARAKNVMGRAVNEFESVGTAILSKQKGLMARGADDLFDAARRSGVKVSPDTFKNTRKTMLELSVRLGKVAGTKQVKQARKVLKETAEFLLSRDGLTIDDILVARDNVGDAIALASTTKGGKRAAGIAKKIFASMSDDLDTIATSPFKKGRQARLAKAAVSRAKLQFSVDTLEQGVARFTKTKGKDVAIDFSGMQQWLTNITNPKHKQFDKNFANALKEELPVLKKRLAELAEIASNASPGGPGALVLRGQGAKIGRNIGTTVVGGLLGAAAGGPVGAAVGGVAGANLPEMMVAILTTKPGAAFLERAARMGAGQINNRAWILAGEIAMRSLGKRDERPMGLTPEEALSRIEDRDAAQEAEAKTKGERKRLSAQEKQALEEKVVGAQKSGEGKRSTKKSKRTDGQSASGLLPNLEQLREGVQKNVAAGRRGRTRRSGR